MKERSRLTLGILFFMLMFFYVGVSAYFSFIHIPDGSYAGWYGTQVSPSAPIIITGADPNGPAAALQAGDELLAVDGVTSEQDPAIVAFDDRVPPGTLVVLTIRRNGQEFDAPITTIKKPNRGVDFDEQVFVFIHLIFLITALTVFVLRHGNRQAWLLALMLGTLPGLFTWAMPLHKLGLVAESLVAMAKILCLWSLPLFVRFFLNFPERSPILNRWPKIEFYLNSPFYLIILAYFGGSRLPSWAKGWYFNLPPIKWLTAHSWFGLPSPLIAGFLIFGVACLAVNYRVSNLEARRKLRVVMIGSLVGILNILLLILAESAGLFDGAPALKKGVEIGVLITLPLIPLSFAYAIIRHKVIPISLILRRSARYLLVSRGSSMLVITGVCIVMFFAMEAIFAYVKPMSGRAAGIISGILGIIIWNATYSFHKRAIAPAIDRSFFRESYDARRILAELNQSVRSTTDIRQLLELVCTKIQKALHAENVSVLLRDDSSGDYKREVLFDHRHNGKTALGDSKAVRLPNDAYLIRRLNDSGEPLAADLNDPNSRLGKLIKSGGDGSGNIEMDALESLNSALLLPLIAKDRLLGVISLGPRLGDLPYSREDEQMLMSVAGQTSFAIENIQLISRTIDEERRRRIVEAENQRRAKELEEARQLQLSMLPKHIPQLPYMEIAAYMKPATEVGGDYYDFFEDAGGELTIAVGDATGHGLKAGTLVTAVKSLFKAFAQLPEPVQIFQKTSSALKRMNLRSMFMAMTIIKVNPGKMSISIAGMPAVLVYRAATGCIEEIAIKGMPLGSLTNYSYSMEETTLAAGDVAVLMSDGLPERFNPDNEMIDPAEINQALIEVADRSPQAIIDRLVALGEAWASGRAQDDDITFVVLKVGETVQS